MTSYVFAADAEIDCMNVSDTAFGRYFILIRTEGAVITRHNGCRVVSFEVTDAEREVFEVEYLSVEIWTAV